MARRISSEVDAVTASCRAIESDSREKGDLHPGQPRANAVAPLDGPATRARPYATGEHSVTFGEVFLGDRRNGGTQPGGITSFLTASRCSASRSGVALTP